MAFVKAELEDVAALCESLMVFRELTPSAHDRVVSVGERLSARVISAILEEKGIPSFFVDLSFVFGEGLDTTQPGYTQLASRAIADTM